MATKALRSKIRARSSEHRSIVDAEMETAVVETAVSVVKWDKFMPRMKMRVLLVEADDSTRQVVAALLRKCSYRVEAVTDGLEAWEVLKGKPRNFDLILAEVDLPSISGFALLTLVMGHDICRNVPVIMMSSQGSVGTVYKCMQRGAADYLVKPIRQNELRNLWQHVWRRRSLNVDGRWPQPEDETVPLREAEATTDSNQISEESIDRAQTDDEFIQNQRGPDVRSSCTKADEEAAKAQPEQPPEPFVLQNNADGASLSSFNFGLNAEREISKKNENAAAKEAIDLIGTFENYQQSHYINDSSSSHHHSSNPEDSLQLDLSLKRTEEMLCVKKSDASAFSRYIHKTMHTERELLHDFNGRSSNTPSPAVSTPKSILPLSNTQSQQPLPLSRQRSFPASVPVPVIVLRSDSESASELMASQQDSSLRVNSFSQFLRNSSNNSHNIECLNHLLGLDTLRDKINYCSPISSESIANANRVFHVMPSEEGLLMHDGNSQQSLQREAALMKFRLKRKMRCFEKKVRYESRKKLAEQRPRVKGQFVRQLNVDYSVPKEADETFNS